MSGENNFFERRRGHTKPAKASMAKICGWRRGVLQAGPIVMGYIPVGFAYGVLAQKAGISPLNTILMSVIVYAGASQFIAVGLFAAQLPALTIILTTFVVNLRHLILSSALAPYLQLWRKIELAAFAFHVTDETFAIHSTRFPLEVPPKPEVFALNVTAQLSWICGGWLGVVAGRLIPDIKPFGLDYALPALFIALLVLQIKHRFHIMIALLTGMLAVILLQLGLNRWNVIVATIIGATIGVMLEQWNNKPSSS